MSVKISDKDIEVFRRYGKISRKEAEKRLGKAYLVKVARAQGHHGKKGGRPSKYPTCFVNGVRQDRHRFWKGMCSLCGTPQK